MRLGRTPIVYVRRGFVGAKLEDASALAAYPLWVAHYITPAAPRIPKTWKEWTFWQHGNNGHGPGIAGPVDKDRFNGSMDALREWVQRSGGVAAATPGCQLRTPVGDTLGPPTFAGCSLSGVGISQKGDSA